MFNLIGGDIAYADPAGNGLANYYAGGTNPSPATGATAGFPDSFDPTIWSAYFVQNESMGKQTPQMFALGNHDQEAVYDGNDKSTAPQNGYLKAKSGHGYLGHAARINLLGGGAAQQFGSPSSSVYGFRHGNVGVVAIDCNDLSLEIQSNTGYTGGGQAAWLDAQLNRFRQDNSIDFVVPFFHHCAYATSSNHHSDNGVRSVVGPLFTKYQVDVVFQGHNHQFERTDPLRYVNGSTVVGMVAPDQPSSARRPRKPALRSGRARPTSTTEMPGGRATASTLTR